MGLELDDVWSRISHWQRSRRLLIDVAIGNIGGAFGVGVFALVFVADAGSAGHSSIAVISSTTAPTRIEHYKTRRVTIDQINN